MRDGLDPRDAAVVELVATASRMPRPVSPGAASRAIGALRRAGTGTSPGLRSWAHAMIVENLLDERRTGWLRAGHPLDAREEQEALSFAAAADPGLLDVLTTRLRFRIRIRTGLPQQLCESADATAEYYLLWCRWFTALGTTERREIDHVVADALWPAVARMRPDRRDRVTALLAAASGEADALAWCDDWRSWRHRHRAWIVGDVARRWLAARITQATVWADQRWRTRADAGLPGGQR
jgi:hypothetical protein